MPLPLTMLSSPTDGAASLGVRRTKGQVPSAVSSAPAEAKLRDELAQMAISGAVDKGLLRSKLLCLTLLQLTESRRGIDFRENLRSVMELAQLARTSTGDRPQGYQLPAGAAEAAAAARQE